MIFQQYLEQQKRNEEAGVLTELVRDFLDPAVFYQQLKNKGIDFYCGVPDSLLKGNNLNEYRDCTYNFRSTSCPKF